jgi:hypothetical protein
MIVFSQPYQIATIDILGTYGEKIACVKEQKRALAIGTIVKTSFGCIRIERVKKS